MRNKLVAAAVVSLAAAPMAAQAASITPYAKVQWEIANESYSASGVDPSIKNIVAPSRTWIGSENPNSSGLTVEDNQRGRFGLKGSEDIGSGMKMHGKVEYDIGGGSQFKGGAVLREANVGITGGWGDVTIGTQKSPYKYIGGVKYDTFVTTNLEARRNGGMLGGTFGQNGFWDNSVSYQAPSSLPVEIWGIYSPDASNGEENTFNAGSNTYGGSQGQGDYALGVRYKGKGGMPWEVFGVVMSNNNTLTNSQAAAAGVGTGNDQFWKAGGKVNFGQVTLLGQYEHASWGGSIGGMADGDKTDQYFLAAHYQLSSTQLVAQYGANTTSFDAGGKDLTGTYYALGAYHKFTGAARIFGGYRHTKADQGNNDATGSAFTVGMRLDF
ncbi:MAG TPA: porin [Gammaproteobacteria bacterium]|nr:porin [Gammaproteobacteria bacterium]